MINFVEEVDENIERMAGGASSGLGTGGMMTKIKAAKLVNNNECHMVIVNGNDSECLMNIFNEKENGTWFQARR